MPMLTWDSLVVGERFGPFAFSVTPELVKRFRAVVGDDANRGAPPAVLTFAFLGLIDSKYEPRPGTIHARQDFEWLAPLRVGAELVVTGVLAAKEERRGRRYFTVEARAVDDEGVEVARSRTVGVYP